MEPTLVDGQTVLVETGREPVVGDVVLARDHQGRDIVKRVHVIAGGVELRGDNAPNSTDSRQYGAVPRHWVQGVVVCVFRAP